MTPRSANAAMPERPAVVVSLSAWARARETDRPALLTLLGAVPWLLRVDIEVQPSGEVQLVVLVAGLTRDIDMCLPSSVNGTPVTGRDALRGGGR